MKGATDGEARRCSESGFLFDYVSTHLETAGYAREPMMSRKLGFHVLTHAVYIFLKFRFKGAKPVFSEECYVVGDAPRQTDPEIKPEINGCIAVAHFLKGAPWGR